MKPGTKPKPSALKKLEGNPGKRALPAHEPQPELGIPSCPAWLKGPGRLEWKRITPELYRLGLLTRIDHAALEAYCLAYGQLVEAESELARMRKVYKDEAKRRKKRGSDEEDNLLSNGMVAVTSNGNTIMEPMLSVRKQALEIMHKFLVEFGMTPASRTRVSGGGDKKKAQSPMEKLLEATREMAN